MNQLPPLRALQAFEVFGRTRSVNRAAAELNVTPGAISQQLKVLEKHLDQQLIIKDGRGVTLSAESEIYHKYISEGFVSLQLAQQYIRRLNDDCTLAISSLPSLLTKWLSPIIGEFQNTRADISIHFESTHQESNLALMNNTFRITYGEAVELYPHHRELFTDKLFPVCSPSFLKENPEICLPEGLQHSALIRTDWGAGYEDVPSWNGWFAAQGIASMKSKKSDSYSLSSLAIEAASEGKGVALAQEFFVRADLAKNNLVRLSDNELSMPKPYYICWGDGAMSKQISSEFLNWLVAKSRNVKNIDG